MGPVSPGQRPEASHHSLPWGEKRSAGAAGGDGTGLSERPSRRRKGAGQPLLCGGRVQNKDVSGQGAGAGQTDPGDLPGVLRLRRPALLQRLGHQEGGPPKGSGSAGNSGQKMKNSRPVGRLQLVEQGRNIL